jgi:3-oxoacyl-[acyl-carrier-protein] synthase II
MNPVITAMSVISPFGLGADAFTSGVLAGRTALSTVDPSGELPYTAAGVVGEFDLAAIIDDSRNLVAPGRAAGLAVGAAGLLLRRHDLAEHPAIAKAVVLGGDLIGTDRAMMLTRQSMTGQHPFQVDTKAFPSSVMNNSAAQCAIRFGLRGPNTTVTTGRMTGLSVLAYARRLHRQGRAPVVLAAAVEDLTPQRSWLTWHGHGAGAADPLGEGCCVFLVESAEAAAGHGRVPLAEPLALEFGVAPHPDAAAEVLAGRIRRALTAAGTSVADVSSVVVSRASARTELLAVEEVLGADRRVLEPASLIGDTDGASAAFQLAMAIACGSAAGSIALVTSADPDGHVGCGLFRIPAAGQGRKPSPR